MPESRTTTLDIFAAAGNKARNEPFRARSSAPSRPLDSGEKARECASVCAIVLTDIGGRQTSDPAADREPTLPSEADQEQLRYGTRFSLVEGKVLMPIDLPDPKETVI
jgi:hypothetical protein